MGTYGGEGTEWADSKINQDGRSSFMHAMKNEDVNQTVEEAKKLADSWVRTQFKLAKEAKEAGKEYEAYFWFGIGLHTLQDATSPAHSGFQSWGDHVSMSRQIAHVLKEKFYPGKTSNLQQINI